MIDIKVIQPGAYEMEPTYYNTREELNVTGVGGVPVNDFSKYLREMEVDKMRFKEEFLVCVFFSLIFYINFLNVMVKIM